MIEVLEDLGMRYPTSKSKKKKRYYLCKCECGKLFEPIADNVRAGVTKSCGCLRRKPPTHGLTRNPNYKRWVNMRLRCTDPENKYYNDYGGRGIKVCDEWLDDPIAYIEYVNSLPNANGYRLSIDRVDNNKGYEPGNLRWATQSEQMTNTRRRASKLPGEPNITWYEKNSKWRVRLKGEHIGYYSTIEEAIVARDKKLVLHST
jgi:hypothetical protein